MGELILCSRPIAAAPFYIEELSVNLYSLEELSYYIFHNVYLLNSDFMSVELCQWIGQELDMRDLSDELREMIRDNVPLHIFVARLLNASGYLAAGEIRDTVDIIAAFENKSDAERKKIRADRLLERKRILEAVFEYEHLLTSEDNIGERLLGDIWHNLGTAYARLFFFEESAECFEKAYKKNRRRQSLRSFLFAKLCLNDRQGFDDTVARLMLSSQDAQGIVSEVEHVFESTEIKRFSDELDHMRSQYSEQSAYMKHLENILVHWEDDYLNIQKL